MDVVSIVAISFTSVIGLYVFIGFLRTIRNDSIKDNFVDRALQVNRIDINRGYVWSVIHTIQLQTADDSYIWNKITKNNKQRIVLAYNSVSYDILFNPFGRFPKKGQGKLSQEEIKLIDTPHIREIPKSTWDSMPINIQERIASHLKSLKKSYDVTALELDSVVESVNLDTVPITIPVRAGKEPSPDTYLNTTPLEPNEVDEDDTWDDIIEA